MPKTPKIIDANIIKTHQQAARTLGVSVPTITNLIAKGLPFLQEGAGKKPWMFDKTAIVEWHEQYKQQVIQRKQDRSRNFNDPELLAARLEKIEAETERIRFKLQREQLKVIPIDWIAEIVENQYSNVKAHLLSLPSKIAPSLVNVTDILEVSAIVTSHIREILDELSAPDDVISKAITNGTAKEPTDNGTLQ